MIGRGVLDLLLHVGHTTGDDAGIDGHSRLAVSRLSRLPLSQLSKLSEVRVKSPETEPQRSIKAQILVHDDGDTKQVLASAVRKLKRWRLKIILDRTASRNKVWTVADRRR